MLIGPTCCNEQLETCGQCHGDRRFLRLQADPEMTFRHEAQTRWALQCRVGMGRILSLQYFWVATGLALLFC